MPAQHSNVETAAATRSTERSTLARIADPPSQMPRVARRSSVVGFHFRNAVQRGIVHGTRIGNHAVKFFLRPVDESFGTYREQLQTDGFWRARITFRGRARPVPRGSGYRPARMRT
jgi:hypothetical protein